VAENIPDCLQDSDRLIRAWTHEGIDCAMAQSPMLGVNGYVKVPPEVILPYDEYHDVALNAHGGITYGPDSAGWIGFDTGHAFDAWLDPDVPEDRMTKLNRKYGIPPDELSEYTKVWTLEKMEEEVNRLAVQVHTLHGR